MGRRTAAHEHSNGLRATAGVLLPSLGHGLLTPLTVLKGEIQLMRRRVHREALRGAERATDLHALDRMSNQVDRLSYEIGTMLDATQLLAEGLDLHPVPTELLGLVLQVLASFHGEPMVRSGIGLDQAAAPIVGVWDELRVKRLLYLLLANAIKYGNGEPCEIRVRGREGQARVEVEDHGIGVPAAEADAIFEAGYRAANACHLPGAGLGLYVARGIVMHHGGAIGAQPRQGGGSIFWFTLPVTRALMN